MCACARVTDKRNARPAKKKKEKTNDARTRYDKNKWQYLQKTVRIRETNDETGRFETECYVVARKKKSNGNTRADVTYLIAEDAFDGETRVLLWLFNANKSRHVIVTWKPKNDEITACVERKVTAT